MEWKKLLSRERLIKEENYSDDFLSPISPFLRDYYTIVSSSHFRRLQDKTQVFSLAQNDSVRNRLTHSLEVASICEILGKKVARELSKKIPKVIADYESQGENYNFSDDLSMVLRCAGLLHDIGNPPFGHSGEVYIRKWFKDHFELSEKISREQGMLSFYSDLTEQMRYDLTNFEGNAQNLRIATSIGKSSLVDVTNYGMCLTSAVLGSIVKYPVKSDENKDAAEKMKGKIGFYHSEDWKYEMISSKIGIDKLNGKYPKNPIMLLMEAADDIAYGTSDIEDFVSLGLIKRDEFESLLPGYVTTAKWFLDDKTNVRLALLKVREKSIDEVVSEFIVHYDEIMNGTYAYELTQECSYKFSLAKEKRNEIYTKRDNENEFMNHALHDLYVIMNMLCTVVFMREDQFTFAQREIIREVGQYYKKGQSEAEYIIKKNNPDVRAAEAERTYHKLLTIADYVSGMTDHYVSEIAAKFHSDYYYENLEEQVVNKFWADLAVAGNKDEADAVIKDFKNKDYRLTDKTTKKKYRDKLSAIKANMETKNQNGDKLSVIEASFDKINELFK